MGDHKYAKQREMSGPAILKPKHDPPNDPKNPKIMTFHPTMEEFSDFMGYIEYMESVGAHLGGIAKIVPPKEWRPRKAGYTRLDNVIIQAPIKQNVRQTATRGAFEVRNTELSTMSVGELRRTALEKNLVYAFAEEMDEIERNFWKQLSINPPIYGADTSGTLFDDDVDIWNIGRLPSALQTITEEYGIAIQGVNTPYLYYGMWRAFFGWHTEDMDLYSINYIHDGAAKFWYSISPSHGRRFERTAEALFPEQYKLCHAFLRHKTTLISHSVLKASGVPFNKIMQHEHEIIITFPYAYHAGFNCGLNVAESTNFATERWIEYGKYASICSCQEDNVKIDMGIFIKKYQPDRLEEWNSGTERGRHPEDDRPNTKRAPTSGPAAASVAEKKRRNMIRRANIAAGVVDQLDSDGSEERSKSTKATPTKRSYPSDDHGHNGPHSFLPRHHVTGTGLKPPKYGRMGAFTVADEEAEELYNIPPPIVCPRMKSRLCFSPTKHDHDYACPSETDSSGDDDDDADEEFVPFQSPFSDRPKERPSAVPSSPCKSQSPEKKSKPPNGHSVVHSRSEKKIANCKSSNGRMEGSPLDLSVKSKGRSIISSSGSVDGREKAVYRNERDRIVAEFKSRNPDWVRIQGSVQSHSRSSSSGVSPKPTGKLNGSSGTKQSSITSSHKSSSERIPSRKTDVLLKAPT